MNYLLEVFSWTLMSTYRFFELEKNVGDEISFMFFRWKCNLSLKFSKMMNESFFYRPKNISSKHAMKLLRLVELKRMSSQGIDLSEYKLLNVALQVQRCAESTKQSSIIHSSSEFKTLEKVSNVLETCVYKFKYLIRHSFENKIEQWKSSSLDNNLLTKVRTNSRSYVWQHPKRHTTNENVTIQIR